MEGLEKDWSYRIVSDRGDFARIVDGTFAIKLLHPNTVKEYLSTWRFIGRGQWDLFVKETGNGTQFLRYIYLLLILSGVPHILNSFL